MSKKLNAAAAQIVESKVESQEKFNPLAIAKELCESVEGADQVSAEAAIWKALSSRSLGEVLPLVETEPGVEPEESDPPEPRLLFVASDWSGFSSTSDHLETDLTRSDKSRGVLRQLVEARRDGSDWVSVEELLTEVWNLDKEAEESDRKRVYSIVHRLRKKGLDVVRSGPGEYGLAPGLEPVFPSRRAMENGKN